MVAAAVVLPLTSPATPPVLDAVRTELSADGQLYALIDLEEGWARIGREMNEALAAADQNVVDVASLLESLGLTRIRAIGMSSRAVPGGYDNRLFLSMPEGRSGLFTLFPGEPRPFASLRHAPLDADLFVELRLDLGAITTTLSSAVENAIADESLRSVARDALGAVEDPLHSAMRYSGTIAFTARLREVGEQPDATSPGFDYFGRVEAVGSLLLPWLEHAELAERVEHPDLVVFRSADGVFVALDGDVAMIASDLAFLDECRSRADGLDQAPIVRDLLARTAAAGHSLVYTSPRLLEKLQGLAGLAQDLALHAGGALRTADRLALAQAFAVLPKSGAPHVSIVVARPDGVLIREISATSNKTALPVVSAFTPDFLGLIAVQATRGMAAALSAGKVRDAAQARIAPDLETIAAAARDYFAHHANEESVSLSTLRVQPGGESLPDLADRLEEDLVIARNSDEIVAWHREHGEIRHVIPLSESQRAAIEANLRQVEMAAARYMVRQDTVSAYGSTVFSDDEAGRPTPVVGEDYDSVAIEDDADEVRVTTPGGQNVSIPRDRALVTRARRDLAEQRFTVEQNLARIDTAATSWFAAHADSYSVPVENLIAEGGLVEPEPVAGENYRELEVYRGSTELYVETSTLGTVRFVRPLDPEVESAVRERLTELAKLTAAWFRANPEARLVLAAELLPPEKLVITHPEADALLGPQAITITPLLTTLVIRRTDTALSVEVDGRGTVTVALR